MAEELTKEERDKRLRSAYGKATQDLRDTFRADFETFYKARAAEEGIDWEPRKSPEQKAREQIEALLAQFPSLSYTTDVRGVVASGADVIGEENMPAEV